MQFFVIGDYDTVLGFSLAGIEGRSVKSPEEALGILRQKVESDDMGIVLITERLAQEMRGDIERIMLTKRLPLIVEIPDMDGPLEEKVTISDLVKTAIGIKI